MDSKLLDRINVLARKSKAEGLTPAEKAEQQKLREQYLAEFRGNFRQRLNNIVLVDPDGTERPLKPRKKN